MGTEAEKKEELDEATAEQLDIDSEPPVEEPEEITADNDAEADGEIEVIRENGTLSLRQDELDGIIKKRVGKLNTKIDKVQQQASKADDALAIEQERTKVLQLALDQQREAQSAQQAPTAPKPDDFDLGYEDPAFQSKQMEFNQAMIQAEVQRQVAQSTTNFVNSNKANEQSRDLERKQIKHYQKAQELNAKNYSDVEDVAIGILGTEVTNQIISNFDNSPAMLFYLGKNEAEAERLSNLIATNPVKGIAEVGRLEAELKVKPKKTTDAPEPDEEIVGGKSSASESALKQMAKYRRAVAENKDPQAMNKLRAYKKTLKEKGITL